MQVRKTRCLFTIAIVGVVFRGWIFGWEKLMRQLRWAKGFGRHDSLEKLAGLAGVFVVDIVWYGFHLGHLVGWIWKGGRRRRRVNVAMSEELVMRTRSRLLRLLKMTLNVDGFWSKIVAVGIGCDFWDCLNNFFALLFLSRWSWET